MKMKLCFTMLTICLTALIGSQAQPQAEAADYFVKPSPVYGLSASALVDAGLGDFQSQIDWFMTTSVAEMNSAVSNSWNSEGIVYYISPAQVPGTVPLYRLYNPSLTDHFYVSTLAERNSAISLGFVPEGIVGFVFPANSQTPGTVPLYRHYKGGKYSYHKYSRDATLNIGGNYEGISCHVWPSETAIVGMSLTAPRTNEELKGRSEYDIAWNSSLKGGYVSLSYSTDAGNTWTPIGSGIGNTGFFKWRVPNTNTLHGRVRIIWTDNLYGETNILARVESPFDFKIKAVQFQGTSQARMAVKPSAPMGLTATVLSSSEVRLSWKASTGNPIAYLIEKQTGQGMYQQIATIQPPSLTYFDKHVSPGTTYFYRMYAVNTSARSAYSNQASAKTAFTLKKLTVQQKPIQKAVPR